MRQGEAAPVPSGNDESRAPGITLDSKAPCDALGQARLAGAQLTGEKKDLPTFGAAAQSTPDFPGFFRATGHQM